jgi:hypothetical protein
MTVILCKWRLTGANSSSFSPFLTLALKPGPEIFDLAFYVQEEIYNVLIFFKRFKNV